MERAAIVKAFIKEAFKEDVIDEGTVEELNNFADWMDENLQFYSEAFRKEAKHE